MTIVEIIIVYFIGVYFAQLQIRYWNTNYLLSEGEKFCYSLLSWGLYLIYGIAWIMDRLKAK